jgi:hypothetical protein
LNSAQIARPGLQRSWQPNTIIFGPSSCDVSYFRLPAEDESHVRARRSQGTASSSPRSSCFPQPSEQVLNTVRCNITVSVDIDWSRIAVLQKQDGRCAHTWSHFIPPNIYRLRHPPCPVCSDALLLYLPLAGLEASLSLSLALY